MYVHVLQVGTMVHDNHYWHGNEKHTGLIVDRDIEEGMYKVLFNDVSPHNGEKTEWLSRMDIKPIS